MRIKINCHKILLLFPLFYLLWLNSPIINAQTYGLRFKGHEVSLDNRTELDLTPDGFIKFKDEFEISFDYKTNRIKPGLKNVFFGYVFRIVNSEDDNIDLISTPTPDIGLNIVIGKSNSIIPVNYPLNAINNWIKLRVKLMLAEDRLIFYTPDTFYVKENVGFKKHESYKIIFGANDFKQFKNSDVPSMTIKNIEISEQGKLKYRWLLNENAGNTGTDEIKGKKAKVKNPIWLVNNYQNWELNFNDDISGLLIFAADTENGKIYMIGLEEFYIYSALDNSIQKIKYKEKPHFLKNSCRAIYNSLDNRVYCYLVDNGLFYSLDINTGEWNETRSSQITKKGYQHHNSYFNDSDNSIFIFGGYGLHTYENVIRRIDIDKNTWEDLPTDNTVFLPRYMAGLGSLNDTLYIMGGYGSQTGNQLINPHSYFDMFGYSIKNGSFFKKFDIPHLIDDMIVGNNMWINEKNRNYYALIFSKSKFNGDLQLLKGNLNSPDVELVGSKIPFKFLDVRSIANLYYMPETNKLYTLTSYATDSTTQVAIYSIANPPNEISFNTIKLKDNKSLVYLYIVIALLLFLISIVYLRKIKAKKVSNKLD
ncbi:MAG: hypothetical protein GQ525_09225, partial [Draconibacterium sp.]|nr:hypothetical protein [Draconibacterium sp.]